MTEDLPAPGHSDNPLISNLDNPRIFDHPVRYLRLIETHISWIILTGEFAYKIKKPVNFGFLDFSTLEKRFYYCQEELRLNRRFAPEIYLQIVAIRGSQHEPRLDGDGEIIEYAVKMREFSQQDLLSERAARNELDAALIDSMAKRVAEVHADCEVDAGDREYGNAVVTRRWAEENLTHLAESIPAKLLPDAYHRLCEWYRHNADLVRIIEQRKAQGHVRECHGDLHLGNIALVQDRIVLFDCLEFNPELRWIDTVSELGFVAMDLQARGYPAYCWRFVNRYLEVSGDYAGVALLRYYFVYRALVRAKVEALRSQQAEADIETHAEALQPAFDYIELAANWAERHRAGLIIMHGLSGSGKSTVAAQLVETLGAIRIRSDIERKRLFGFGANDDTGSSLEGGIYTADASAKTYEHICTIAKQIIEADFCVIVDATFLRQSQRYPLLEMAVSRPFRRVIVDCDAPVSELERRILQRAQDASEADLAVLHQQLDTREPITAAESDQAPVVRVGTEGLDRQKIEQIRNILTS